MIGSNINVVPEHVGVVLPSMVKPAAQLSVNVPGGYTLIIGDIINGEFMVGAGQPKMKISFF